MSRLIMICFALLALTNVAMSQTVVPKGTTVKTGFTGNIYGSVYINIDTDGYDDGWRLRIINNFDAEICSGDGKTHTCTNLAGGAFAELIAPNKLCSEVELKFSNKGNQRFTTPSEGVFCTEQAVQDAYFRYKTGECAEHIFSIPKGSFGHIVESKYVCTNDPQFPNYGGNP